MCTKVCKRCGVEKELSLFGKQASNKDGYRGVCKECQCGHLPLKRYRSSEDVSDKECTKCHEILPVDNFLFINKDKGYRSSYCNTCRNKEIGSKRGYDFYRKRKLRRDYSLTVEDFDVMLLQQGNRCKICGKEFKDCSKNPVKNSVCIDHDHSTGKVRGLLCDYCNKGLGFFKDSIVNLQSAIEYLTPQGVSLIYTEKLG